MVQINKILCPVDFFPASEQAVAYATAMAQNYEAELLLFHAVVPVLHAAYELPLNTDKIVKAMSEESTRRLEDLARPARKGGVEVRTIVRTGDIDDEIKRIVNKEKADFIVMGTHGRRGVEAWFMGSVTQRLLRHVPVPLLTMGASKRGDVTPPAIRRILVTTDFSDGTADAMAYAFSIAQECQARVTVMHVINDVAIDLSGKYRDPLVRGIEEELGRLIPEEAKPWCDIRTRVEIGLPYRAILKTLEREKIDLLVMNIHGKGMLDRALLGSTAERVVRGAGCPALLIPPMGKKRKGSKKKAA
jgi:nucleotide-binding universal stress UspA family protein